MKLATTQLLRQSCEGDESALNHLFSLVYGDLHRRAQLLFLNEGAPNTLQPTALVHEAFLRMVDQRQANWRDRAQFCRVAALVMRRILVDSARKRRAEKRGSGQAAQELTETSGSLSPARPEDVLLVDQLLERLAVSDPRQAQIVELRFFAGMTVAEVAEALELPKRTVEAEWTMVRAIFRMELSARGAAAGG